MISIIIPSHKEKELQQTIDSLLTGAKGEVEVIAVMDGYWANPPLKADPRVHIIHHGKSRGMRSSINAGVSLAKGKYILKTDAHCMFAPGWDEALLSEIEDKWVVYPRMFKLDTIKWEVMPDKPIDYYRLTILEDRSKFHGVEWISRGKQRKDIMVDESMIFQGSCWIMSRKLWDKVVGPLQEEGYGKFVQEPTEIAMKVWQSGGKVMVNKKTWYAHKHRKFNRTHHVTREEQDAGNVFALNYWKDQYQVLKERFGI